MSPYLQRIWNRAVRAFRLKIEDESGNTRVLAREQVVNIRGGTKHRFETVVRYVLVWYRTENYIDFQIQTLRRSYSSNIFARDTVIQVHEHFTVSDSGKTKRMYSHAGLDVYAVRSISLKNFYLLPDRSIARLVMMTSPALDWIKDLPVNYHPVSNKDLLKMTSVDDFIAYFAGRDTVVPKRLRLAFPVQELMKLIQVVPGEYLNPLAAILKTRFVPADEPTVENLILVYYRRNRIKDGNNYLHHVVYSYVKTCRYLGVKVNMRIRHRQRLDDERNAAWRGRDLKRIPVIHTNRELIIPSGRYDGISIKLINSCSGLLKEGTQMKNCVTEYAADINAGICAIYHVTYQRKPYTLEVQQTAKGKLVIAQLMGKMNNNAPAELKKALEHILTNHKNIR